MSTVNTRAVVDWFRTWAQDRLDAIGRTDIASNMNVPLTNDVRVTAAIGFVNDAEADVWAIYDPAWQAVDNPTWMAEMPPAVAAVWLDLFEDPDDNVRILVKSTVRMVAMLEIADAAGV